MAVYPERRKGRLSGQWIAEVTQHGERRRKRFATKLEAERWADFTKVTGAPPADAEEAKTLAHPFGGVVKEALARHPGWAADRDHSRHQRLEYALDLLGPDTPIEDITRASLDRLVTSLKKHPGSKGGKLSPGTINRYLTQVSSVLRYAVEHDYIKAMPSIPWQREDGKRIHWLTIEQENALSKLMLAEGREIEELTMRVLTQTGMRWGELETLTPQQIVVEGSTGWVKLDKTKTDTPRDIPIEAPIATRLRQMVAEKAIPKYNTFRGTLKRILKIAGQNTDLSIHCLRHTTATRLVHADVNLAVVQKFLGHRSINTTLKYTHVGNQALQDAMKKVSPHAGQSTELVAAVTNGDAQEVPENQGKLGAAGEDRTHSSRLCTPNK